MQAASGGQGQRARRPPLPTSHRTIPADAANQRTGRAPAGWPDMALELRLPRPSIATRVLRNIRVCRRMTLILGWTAIACPVQSVLLMLPGRGKVRFAARYWAVVSRMIGMRVRLLGEAAGAAPRDTRRPVIYVCNHSSWIDVPVLGGRLHACFVAKEEVGGWPVVGTVARLGRTLFVSRQRKATGRERDDMSLRLKAGDDLILFPEGTSSDGSHVLPFHSAFFAAAKSNTGAEPAPLCDIPLVQPVSIVYDRLGSLPVSRANRAMFSWYGDMDLASHFAQLARWRGMRATIWLHDPLDPADYPSRKALSQAAWDAIAHGTAALRQNRPLPAQDRHAGRLASDMPAR